MEANMQLFWNVALSLVIAYLYGSIPFGLIIVWFAKKKDLRTIESGRTGGTNAMRAAGLVAGLLTALKDV
jgi:glycerol-3-phosphate acyltransferase PlsY